MNKLIILAFIRYLTLAPQLYSVSLEDHIKQHGIPQIKQGGILDLSHKNLTDLTGLPTIAHINSVTWLNLSHNQLHTLPADSFGKLSHLFMLDLSSNQIQTVPDILFNNLSNLAYLHLNNNQLYLLPNTVFQGLHSLLWLSLDNNQFQKLPDTLFSTLPNLEFISLLGNPFNPDFIPTLNSMLRTLPRLQRLDDQSKNQALNKQPFLMLKQSIEKYVAKNIKNYTQEQLDRLPQELKDNVQHLTH